MSEHLRFDELEDLICSLEHAAGTARAVSAEPYKWKWLLLSLDNALHGAMISALGASAETPVPTGAMPVASRDTDEWLTRPAQLFAECQKAERMSVSGGQPLSPTGSQMRSFALLDEMRRQFVHYRPVGWSIEKARLIKVTTDVLQIVGQLMNHPAIQIRLTADQRNRLSDALERITHWLH